VAVERERRSGVDRRARVLSSLSVRDHIIIHALRRLIGRLYQIAKTQSRYAKVQERLAEARSEILKLDPSLYLVAKVMDGLKGGAIGKLEEFQHAQEMLARFLPAPGTEKPTKRKSTSRNGAKRATTSGRTTTKATSRKTATTKKKTTKKRLTKKKSPPAARN
jgi:hypothetical protein